MKDNLTIREVAIVTGLHRNTIRNYVKAGRLKANLIGEGRGKQKYLIKKEDLYNCDIPRVLAHLGPLEVTGRLEMAQVKKADSLTEEVIAETMRLNRELQAAREELGGLRVQVPMLQAAQVERDQLREDLDLERTYNGILREKLEEARGNARWTWRRKHAKDPATGDSRTTRRDNA
jgi:excisionase family DNA binding protein